MSKPTSNDQQTQAKMTSAIAANAVNITGAPAAETNARSGGYTAEAKHAFVKNLFDGKVKFLGRLVTSEQAKAIVNGAVASLPDKKTFSRDSFDAIRCIVPGCARGGVHGLGDDLKHIEVARLLRKQLLFQRADGSCFTLSDTCALNYLDPISKTGLANPEVYAPIKANHDADVDKGRISRK